MGYVNGPYRLRSRGRWPLPALGALTVLGALVLTLYELIAR
ncbi:hypothetical protein SALCHL_003587 [Streptomyces albus subsp. chlorinus]|nr:hypothetical protein [Streptomyces albus]